VGTILAGSKRQTRFLNLDDVGQVFSAAKNVHSTDEALTVRGKPGFSLKTV